MTNINAGPISWIYSLPKGCAFDLALNVESIVKIDWMYVVAFAPLCSNIYWL
jgi:hypothetical protein